MHVLMVTDAYPPMRTSCAVQMHDLAQVFIAEGHQVTIITPTSTQKERVHITRNEGVRLIQVKAFETKDINYASRTLAELINPFVIWHKLKKCPEFLDSHYDGIIWYSPTIFWGPLIKKLKRQYKVKAYLILRDIFPDWALDLGLLKNGLIYQFLKKIERYQYQQADIIGLQSPNNLKFFEKKNVGLKSNLEVLWNWVGGVNETPCSIDLSKTGLAGRMTFVYAGNMGVAQGIDVLMNLVKVMQHDRKIGFVFVGRGSEVRGLKQDVSNLNLDNILFFDEIAPSELPGLYRQCSVGLIALDRRHSSHNIPGKFVSYAKAGLPVIAFVNAGNDLVDLIAAHQLGCAFVNEGDVVMGEKIKELCGQIQADVGFASRAYNLTEHYFSAASACNRIVNSLGCYST